MIRESLHTPEIEHLRKLVAEKRKHEGSSQRQKPAINLLSFFRGPTAKLLKAVPWANARPKQGDVKITSVSYSPNIESSPKQVYHKNPPMQNILPANFHSSQQLTRPAQNKQHEQAQVRYVPKKIHTNNNRILQSFPTQALPKSVPAGRMFEQQKETDFGPKQNQNNIQIPVPGAYRAISQDQGLRNLDRVYNQEYRKFNGNPKVDPSLLLSEGYWSKPLKVQPKTRSIPVQSQLTQDYPGKVYHTLTLPVDNTAPKPQATWNFARNSPTRKPLTNVEQFPTDKRSELPGKQLANAVPIAQDSTKSPMLNLSYSNRNQPSPDQLFIGPVADRNQLNHKLIDKNPVSNLAKSLEQNLQLPDTYMNQIGNTERKNYIVSIRKRRSLDGKIDPRNDHDVEDENRILGFNPEKIHDQAKRDVLEDTGRQGDETDQDSLLESLTNDESDGGEVISKAELKKTDNERILITGTATATKVNTPGSLENNVEKSNNAEKREKFRLIEKMSYRPNEDYDNAKKASLASEDESKSETTKPKSTKPIVVNLPLANGNTAPKDMSSSAKPLIVNLPNDSKNSGVNSKKLGASQQGLSLDIAPGYSRTTPADPKETSSYTEGHLDNPGINAVASANINTGDNEASDARTSSNVEITGIEGQATSQPSSQPAPQPEEQTGPVEQSSIQGQAETPPQGQDNGSPTGTEESKEIAPPETAEPTPKGMCFQLHIIIIVVLTRNIFQLELPRLEVFVSAISS